MSRNSSSYFPLILVTVAICILTFLRYSKPDKPTPTWNTVEEVIKVDNYENQEMKVLRRQSFLVAEKSKSDLLNASKGSDHDKFYGFLKIEAFCPRKMRVGGSGDGGKFVCNPEKAKNNCTMLSLGLFNKIDYESHIQKLTNYRCNLLGADMNEQKPNTKIEYEKIRGKTFVGKIPDTLTISELLRKGGNNEVEMLKIDIEEGEHTGLEPFLKETFVCQIFVEIHGTPAKHLEMLQKISKLGFRMFSYEPNIYCKHCCEYSFINEMCMHRYEVVPLASTIPLTL